MKKKIYAALIFAALILSAASALADGPWPVPLCPPSDPWCDGVR